MLQLIGVGHCPPLHPRSTPATSLHGVPAPTASSLMLYVSVQPLKHVPQFPTQLTGHSSWLQSLDKLVAPVQSVPSFCASVLVRVWEPPPHGSEHAPQSDKLQLTAPGQSLVFVEFLPH